MFIMTKSDFQFLLNVIGPIIPVIIQFKIHNKLTFQMPEVTTQAHAHGLYKCYITVSVCLTTNQSRAWVCNYHKTGP